MADCIWHFAGASSFDLWYGLPGTAVSDAAFMGMISFLFPMDSGWTVPTHDHSLERSPLDFFLSRLRDQAVYLYLFNVFVDGSNRTKV